MMDWLQANPWALCLAIVLARIGDVSLGTLRTILLFRSYRALAALVGFFEVLIWLLAAGQVLHNLDRWYLVIAYATGYASGNWVGIWLESKVAMGVELVRFVSEDRSVSLAVQLRVAGYSCVTLDAHDGRDRPVEVVLVVEKRRRIGELIQRAQSIDPEAYWTVSDVRAQPSLTAGLRRKAI